ncbi:MAG: hypothetical protein ACI3XF_04210 [Eubacteriales bacterium]
MTNKGRTRNRKKSFWATDGEWNAIEKIAAKTGMGDGEYHYSATQRKEER